MCASKIVTINSRKFDNRIHRSWQAEFLEQKDSELLFVGKFEKEVNHLNLGVIRRATTSYEFYWLDRFYNIFRFHEPEGELRNFYCNVNLPPTFKNGVLDYVDLDVDILVSKSFEYEILDIEEFEENSKKYKYPEKVKQIVNTSVKTLINLIENREYPFNFEI